MDRFKILIVDNDRSHILVLSEMLKPMYSIFAAKDGQAALKIASENVPDLILLDVVMPDMSGYEVLTELRKNDRTSKIPVIFITGLGGTEDEEKGFELGAVDYITKPFKDSIVKARVRTQLQIIEYIRQIESLGLIDLLTQLHNRRGLDNQLQIEWYHALRSGAPVSILMIDIDRFKLYNDTYGHIQGDEALRAVASIFRKSSKRRTDMIARWGGEEFVILLPGTSLERALDLAESIRMNVENAVITCPNGTPTPLTVSIGVNTRIPADSDKITDFINAADKALYAAKNAGRNKVIPAEQSLKK